MNRNFRGSNNRDTSNGEDVGASRSGRDEGLGNQRSPSPRENFLRGSGQLDGTVQLGSLSPEMQAALRAARRVEWRVRNDFTGDSQQEYFQGHSGIPDTSNTRLDNAEPKQPQDHLIRILRNESLRNNFIEILQDKRCRDRYLARLPSSWSEFNEGARNVLNDDRLRNAFIKMIQTHRLRDRFIHLLRSLLFREGERTPSLASDDESDDSSSSISTSFGDDVVRPFPHRLDEEEINDERADSPDGGIRPFGP